MVLRNFNSLGIYCLYEGFTAVWIFTSPEVMWTLIPYTEVRFYPDVKSQTGFSSFRVSRKRALTITSQNFISINHGWHMFEPLCQSLIQHATSMLNQPNKLCSKSHICTIGQLCQILCNGVKSSFLTSSS